MWTAVWRILYGPTFRAMQPPSLARRQFYSSLHQDVRLPRRQRIWRYVSTQKVMRPSPLALPRSLRGNTRPLIWPSPTSFGATHMSTRAIQRGAAQDYDEAIRLNPKNAAAFYNREMSFSAWADMMRRSRTTMKPSS